MSPNKIVVLAVCAVAVSACAVEEQQLATTGALGDGSCQIVLTPPPGGVLNAAADEDGALPGLQVAVSATSEAGWAVELLVQDIDTAEETVAATQVADGEGAAEFTATLSDGERGLRLRCTAPDESNQ